MELKFSPFTVMAVEKEAGKPLTELLSVFSISTIVLLVKHGARLESDEQAADAVESYLNEGNDTVALYLHVLEMLQGAGFLPRSLDIQTMREKMNAKLNQ
jgi:L-alanine-DL-glutamate epimerase-like enolase superfamily enzyme